MVARAEAKPPFLERAIAAIAPGTALRRAEARAKMARIVKTQALYDAATFSRRTQGWRSISTDANAETRTAIGRLRDVARDMVRNNAFAARIQASIAHNVVGPGIVAQVNAATDKRKTRITALLKQHFDTTEIDADGKHNLYGLQELMMKTIAESGEVLVRRRLRKSTDGLALPFQIQVLEPDFLDACIEGPLPNGNYAIQGVEFDLRGKIVAYYLYDQHPGSMVVGLTRDFRGSRVSADFVAHIYRVDRPGQVRGVSWFAPVMVRMRDYADYVDAQLLRQKIAACFSAFITSDADATNPDGSPLPMSASGIPMESFEPGMIQRLRQGETVTFATPPTTQDFGSYSAATMREIASGVGVPYETATGDLTGVNFISGRLGKLDFRRNITVWQWNMLIPQGLDKIAKWTIEAAVLATSSTEPFTLSWTPPAIEMTSPADEIAAAKDAIRSGLSSRSNEVRKLGMDPIELDAEIAEDNARADGLNLAFDSDPRLLTTRGVSQKNADPNAPDFGPAASNN